MHVTISNLEFMYIDRHLICDVNLLKFRELICDVNLLKVRELICDVNLLNICDVNLLNIYMVTQREFAYLQGK